MKIRLKEIRSVAMQHPGMMDAFLSAGIPAGDSLEISREEFEAINAHFFQGMKLGTLLHEVLEPAVKVADQLLGTHLSGCGGCAARELKLNQWTHPS